MALLYATTGFAEPVSGKEDASSSVAIPRFSDSPMIEIRPAHAEVSGVDFDIAVGTQAEIETRTTSSWTFVGAGVISVPMSAINPVYGLGVLYPFIGPPMNAVFNARQKMLIRIFSEEPLPERLLSAIRAQLPSRRIESPLSLKARITRFGLVTRAATPAAVFKSGTEMCLVTRVQFAVLRSGRERHRETLELDVAKSSVDAPPPVCASFAQFAKDDGVYLRYSIHEMAEILAAMLLSRLEEVGP